MDNQIENFNWQKYESGYKGEIHLIPNQNIKGSDNKNKCFSREPYAQQLFNVYTSNDSSFVKKDLNKGDCVIATNIYIIKDTKIMLELLGGLSIDIDMSREKRFIQLFGYQNVMDFINSMKNPDYIKEFISFGIYVYVIDSSPLKVSLWQGHLKKIKEEFMQEISTPTKAYIAKVIEANKGGFFVDVQGVDAFMPGSLAAPNKIIDFKSYVGKEVVVMIEDFLTNINSFIVSHKKYLEHVIPKRINELDLNKKYKGNITGTSKYGIFVEFDEIFTGLLHNSKMKEETKNKFNNFKYKPGDEIEFYINEITKDNRIILTEENPDEKKLKFNKFIEENKNKILKSSVVAIMNFGVIVNINELSGLIPSKEFKKRKMQMNNFIVGDELQIKISEFKDDKLIFDLYFEKDNLEGV